MFQRPSMGCHKGDHGMFGTRKEGGEPLRGGATSSIEIRKTALVLVGVGFAGWIFHSPSSRVPQFGLTVTFLLLANGVLSALWNAVGPWLKRCAPAVAGVLVGAFGYHHWIHGTVGTLLRIEIERAGDDEAPPPPPRAVETPTPVANPPPPSAPRFPSRRAVVSKRTVQPSSTVGRRTAVGQDRLPDGTVAGAIILRNDGRTDGAVRWYGVEETRLPLVSQLTGLRTPTAGSIEEAKDAIVVRSTPIVSLPPTTTPGPSRSTANGSIEFNFIGIDPISLAASVAAEAFDRKRGAI